HGSMTRATNGRAAWRSMVIAIQAALAVTAVIGAGLLLRTGRALASIDPGFEPDGLVLVQYRVPYANFNVPPEFFVDLDAIVERVRARPDVEAATPVLSPPLSGRGGFDAAPRLRGRDEGDWRDNPYLSLELAGPDHFATFGMTLRAGRGLTAEDDQNAARAIVITESAARALWPGRTDVIGEQLSWPFPGFADVWWTVVGVAADTRYRELLLPRPTVYLPLTQFKAFPPPYLALRMKSDAMPAALLPDLQRIVDEVHPRLRVLGATRISTVLAEPTIRPRFTALVLGLFAGIALFLACIGIYAVLAHFVSGHTRELGVRRSLGAQSLDVWLLVVGRGVRAALAGGALGLLLAVIAARSIRAVLFGVSFADPATLLLAALAIIAVAAIATAIPAVRAARIAPAEALRTD
ncbi:MAG: ABC transporter permease, partial [Gemmatimonadetes bacterium]|nr:ABC transporter permease [Gemmatimonadota bacterium]